MNDMLKEIDLYSLIISVVGGLLAYLFLYLKLNVHLQHIYAISIWIIFTIIFYLIINKLNLFTIIEEENAEKKFFDELVKHGVLEMPLEKISVVWQEEGKIEIGIDKFSINWRDQRKIEMEKKYKQIRNDKIRQFHEYVKSLFDKFFLKNGDENYNSIYYVEFNIIQMLLIKLDRDGECSSVVSPQGGKVFKGNEPDAIKLEQTPSSLINGSGPDKKNITDSNTLSTWQLLSGVTLLEHTLNVVSNIINIVQDKYGSDLTLYLSDAVIVALSHDLGKIPSEYANTIESHPFISEKILSRVIKGSMFEKVVMDKRGNKKEEIIALPEKKAITLTRVVRDHHKRTRVIDDKEREDMGVEQYERLLDILKEADKKARIEEIRNMMRVMGLYEIDQPQPPKQEYANTNVTHKEDKKSVSNEITDFNKPIKQQQKEQKKDVTPIIKIDKPNPVFPEFDTFLDLNKNKKKNNTKKNKPEYEKIDLKCDWLTDEIDNIIDLIDTRINLVRIVRNTPVYIAFTIKDTVLVTSLTIIQIMSFFAEKNNDQELVMRFNTDDNYRRAAALLLVDELRKAKFINESDVKPGYFGGHFVLEKQGYNDDKIITQDGYYTPMSLHAFANINYNGNIAIYEQRKKSSDWDKLGVLKQFKNYKWSS